MPDHLLPDPKTEKHTDEYKTVTNLNKGYYAATSGMQGKRKTMEDAHQIKLEALNDTHFMMVCDGHGGDFCALQTAELMLPHILEKDNIPTKRSKDEKKIKARRSAIADTLKSSFMEVDKKLLALEPIANNDDFSGTTVCAAIITEDEVICANCGDTRCVLSADKKAKDLSSDHKPTKKSEMERIIKAGGRVINGRVNAMHGVARSLGDFSYKDDGEAEPDNQIVTCKPELMCYERGDADDDFVLICCDGVWDVMKSQEAVTFIHNALDKNEVKTLGQALELLLDMCLAKGSNDNMTAAIIAFPDFAMKHNYFRNKKSAMCSVS
ncbi:hypothetical protein ScalyP_jg7009 [Parmales sp. scaly parma]|nr:hypothetical protein ScalyP_jg7009 [Parmales sp. scaly parma]